MCMGLFLAFGVNGSQRKNPPEKAPESPMSQLQKKCINIFSTYFHC